MSIMFLISGLIIGGVLIYSFHYLYPAWIGGRANPVEIYEDIDESGSKQTSDYGNAYAQPDASADRLLGPQLWT